MVETAVVLVTFLSLVLGMLDLGTQVLRSNMVSEAARMGARAAIVHGTEAAAGRPRGGMGEWETAEEAQTEVKKILDPFLAGVGVDSEDVEVIVTFPDGNHLPGSPVNVEVTANYRAILPSLFGSGRRKVVATSRMIIAN